MRGRKRTIKMDKMVKRKIAVTNDSKIDKDVFTETKGQTRRTQQKRRKYVKEEKVIKNRM